MSRVSAKNCKVAEQDTAEKLEIACASVTVIPVPLTDGTNYGPKTIPGGPYGEKSSGTRVRVRRS